MINVEIYTKSWCPYCARAKSILNDLQVPFTEYDVTEDRELEQEMRQRAQRTSVPQIFFNGLHIGGCDDLVAVVASGEIERLLEASDQAAQAA